MKKTVIESTATPAQLRCAAEAQLRRERRRSKPPHDESNTHRLLHELEVHQIELRLQNSELIEARNEMELALEKYTDLYDFAPVGFFSLDDRGQILEVNRRGAALLNRDRSQLVHQQLPPFMPPAFRPQFLAFLEKVFAGSEIQIGAGAIFRPDGALARVDLKAIAAPTLRNNRKWCRLAILAMPEAAQRRLDALAASNQELNQEIARRQAVEEALRNSQRQQAQLLEQSQAMQERLRQLSHQILHAQEAERKRISRELHDKIAQTLVGINVHLESLAHTVKTKPAQIQRKITRTQRLVEQLVADVHQYSLELRPSVLDDLGLIPALHSHLKLFAAQSGVRATLTAYAEIERLDQDQRMVLFRIAQEALTNVARHAHASRVEVSIHKQPDGVCLRISDNGQAFDVNHSLRTQGKNQLGLLGMRERLEMVGGHLEIISTPDTGTVILARIPFDTSRAARAKGSHRMTR